MRASPCQCPGSEGLLLNFSAFVFPVCHLLHSLSSSHLLLSPQGLCTLSSLCLECVSHSLLYQVHSCTSYKYLLRVTSSGKPSLTSQTQVRFSCYIIS